MGGITLLALATGLGPPERNPKASFRSAREYHGRPLCHLDLLRFNLAFSNKKPRSYLRSEPWNPGRKALPKVF